MLLSGKVAERTNVSILPLAALSFVNPGNGYNLRFFRRIAPRFVTVSSIEGVPL